MIEDEQQVTVLTIPRFFSELDWRLFSEQTHEKGLRFVQMTERYPSELVKILSFRMVLLSQVYQETKCKLSWYDDEVRGKNVSLCVVFSLYVINLFSWEELFFILKLWSPYILSVRCVVVVFNEMW